MLNIEYDSKIIIFVNIYVFNFENDWVDFFKKVLKWILKYFINNENVIFVGDFNCFLLKDKDKSLNSFKNL